MKSYSQTKICNTSFSKGKFNMLDAILKSHKLHKCKRSTAHTHTVETHSMEKVPSMENFSINQTE